MKNDFIKNNNKNRVVKKPKKSRVVLAFTLIILWTVGAICGIVGFVRGFTAGRSAYVAYAEEVTTSFTFNSNSNIIFGGTSTFKTGTNFSLVSSVDSYTLNVLNLSDSLQPFLLPLFSYQSRGNLVSNLTLSGLHSWYFGTDLSSLTAYQFDSLPYYNTYQYNTTYFYSLPLAYGSNSVINYFMFGFVIDSDISTATSLISFSVSDFTFTSVYGDNASSFALSLVYTTDNGSKMTFYFNGSTTSNYIYYYTENVSSDDSFSTGYNSGYTNGYNAGYDAGISSNATSIYNNGYNAGYTLGYSNGYSAGEYGANSYTFTRLLGAVFDAPIQAFTGLLNFDILGVNMSSFMLALFSVCIVITIVKFML